MAGVLCGGVAHSVGEHSVSIRVGCLVGMYTRVGTCVCVRVANVLAIFVDDSAMEASLGVHETPAVNLSIAVVCGGGRSSGKCPHIQARPLQQ